MTWQTFTMSEFPRLLPNSPGVYVFMRGGELLYIGSSERLRERIASYPIEFGYANNISTPWGHYGDGPEIVCKISLSRRCGDWLMREYRLIKRLQPKFNRRGIRRAA